MLTVVNGQVVVPGGGHQEVLTPGGCSGLVHAGASLAAGLAHAERLALGGHHDAVVQQPVQQADGGGVLGEEAAPLLEWPVRADAQGAAFVGGGDEPEQ